MPYEEEKEEEEEEEEQLCHFLPPSFVTPQLYVMESIIWASAVENMGLPFLYLPVGHRLPVFFIPPSLCFRNSIPDRCGQEDKCFIFPPIALTDSTKVLL